ncbi:MAG: L-2-hydroxycarboxylate dehydrogenase (NAD+) [Verrucomicrobia bacterium]|nr:MAG: L-2-hydroxycarboxylate dehydrogenase (NAD+) [Verrucomicrobiota bacterium]
MEEFRIVPESLHNDLVTRAYQHRGYTAEEAALATRMCADATRHGNRTHNALKALHLDHLFGTGIGEWKPGAQIEVRPTRFPSVQHWNANRKIGQAVAYQAFDTCIELAETYGVGVVAVDNATHYLWGGGYAIDVAKRGYIAYTNCTSSLAEVVPFGGKFPTLGTNPHTWGFPTTDAVGFPIVLDWATSTVAMGRVQQLKREGGTLPPDSAVDHEGRDTRNPNEVYALKTFGAHKGYGMALLNELFGAAIGGSLPTIRNRPGAPADEKTTASFYFQVIHPEAIRTDHFAQGRSLAQNLTAVIRDILGHGNETCMLPGQPEADGAKRTAKAGGLLFSNAEIAEFAPIAHECGADERQWLPDHFPVFQA